MSHLSLQRNVTSDIRLPSFKTLAQQSNIRLPNLRSPASPKDTQLPSLSLSHQETAASSLVQLSKSERTLPQPILSNDQQKIRSNSSDLNNFVPSPVQRQERASFEYQHQPSQTQVNSTQMAPPHPAQAGYSYNTPPPSSNVYYSPPLAQANYQAQQHPPQPMYYAAGTPNPAPVPQESQTPPQQHVKHLQARNQLSCQRCGTTETPEWRRGPNGSRTLCNACGLYHAKLVKKKGALAAAEEMKFKKVKSSMARPTNRGRTIVGYQHAGQAPHQENSIMLSQYHMDALHHQLQQQHQQQGQGQQIPVPPQAAQQQSYSGPQHMYSPKYQISVPMHHQIAPPPQQQLHHQPQIATGVSGPPAQNHQHLPTPPLLSYQTHY